MTFFIKGCDRGVPVEQTRERAASAGVLAMKWTDRGVEKVRIEHAGHSFDLTGFRNQFVVTRHGIRDWRPLRL